MERTLITEGIINRNLFHVQGKLVETYNAALESLTGKRTALTSFHIDKRGESPEIEAELGKNVLQCSSSHRFMIIISPDQQAAGLIHEEFSFDETILNRIYKEYMPAISVATRLDGLFGELNDGVRAYHAIEDLLLPAVINVNLKSTSGFLEKAIETQRLVRVLTNEPEKLIEDECRVVDDLFKLAGEVGDIRGFSDLTTINIDHTVNHFFTRLFNGAYVFRKNKNCTFMTESIEEKEPPGRIPLSMTTEKIAVIYNDAEIKMQPESDLKTLFIPVSDTEAVLTYLLKNRLVTFSESLIDTKMTIVEDNALLESGINVTEMSPEERTMAVSEKISEMPEIWKELIDFKRQYARGKKFTSIEASPLVKGLLLVPSAPDEVLDKMVAHLLTRLFPYNYEWMLKYNQSDLIYYYNQSDELKRDYLLAVLRNMKN